MCKEEAENRVGPLIEATRTRECEIRCRAGLEAEKWKIKSVFREGFSRNLNKYVMPAPALFLFSLKWLNYVSEARNLLAKIIFLSLAVISKTALRKHNVHSSSNDTSLHVSLLLYFSRRLSMSEDDSREQSEGEARALMS
jgi:hypothetical protein